MSEEIKQQIINYLAKATRMQTPRDVVKAISGDSSVIKKAISELVNEGKIEYSQYGGASFIKLAE